MVFLVATSAFIGMTLYGLAARTDIGVKGSIGAAMIAAGLALAIVFTQFEKSAIIYMSFCCIFVFAAIVFVAIDTQMILKEKRYGITQDDYVVAALVLVIDFFNVFTHICKVVRRKKRGSR
jgi:FtsH-binding integral membrane protein